MELLTDVVFLSRLQFALTIFFHFLFVPLSIGLGLFVALTQTRAYKTKDPKDEADAWFWVRIFTLTFTVGVATGITMEFSFGSNWANYSRFVGDIFGSPLAAEGLFAFFLESTFLGILLFGRKKVSPKFYTVSSWLVWAGSLLSALWILIANSWMQTPTGYEVVTTAAGTKAQITDFFAAVANPETVPTYFHTVIALIIFGAFIAMGIASYYHLKGRNEQFVDKMMRWGCLVALIATVGMMPVAHMQAKVVALEQPSKLAAMEGQYETEPVPMYLMGMVDTENQEVIGVGIPGLTSWLINGDPTEEFSGLNDIEADNPGTTPSSGAVSMTFTSYHLMIIMMGLICIGLLIALLLSFGKRLKRARWPWKLMTILWIAPFLAIQTGWVTAEVGRQPWIVFGELKTVDGVSTSVPASDVTVTIVLFTIIYLIILIAWIRFFSRFVKEGPEHYFETKAGMAAAEVSVAEGSNEVAQVSSLDTPIPADSAKDDAGGAAAGPAVGYEATPAADTTETAGLAVGSEATALADEPAPAASPGAAIAADSHNEKGGE